MEDQTQTTTENKETFFGTDAAAEPVEETKHEDGTTLAILEKRLKDKDAFIEQLKGETAGLREDINGLLRGQEELDKLREEMRMAKDRAAPQSQGSQPPSLNEADIEKLVANAMTKREREATTSQNINTAKENAIAAFGSTELADKAFQETLARTGLTSQELSGIAARSPTAFNALLGTPPKGERHIDRSSTVNTEAFSQRPDPSRLQPGTKEYFDAIRKTDKKRYWSQDVQNQIFKARQEGTYKV